MASTVGYHFYFTQLKKGVGDLAYADTSTGTVSVRSLTKGSVTRLRFYTVRSGVKICLRKFLRNFRVSSSRSITKNFCYADLRSGRAVDADGNTTITTAMSMLWINLFIVAMGLVCVAVTMWDCDWQDPDR